MVNYCKLMIFLVFITLAYLKTYAQVDVSGDDKYVCAGDEVTIGPKNSNPDDCYFWEPKELLNNNTVPNPVATISETTTFKVTVTGKDFSYKKTGNMIVHILKVDSISGLSKYTCKAKGTALTAHLTDNQELPVGYSIVWGGDGEFSNQDGLKAKVKFKTSSKDATVTARLSKGQVITVARTTVVGFKVSFSNDYVCDGMSADLQIDPVPEGTPRNVLNGFNNFKLISQTATTSYGNPLGKAELSFKPLDNSYRSAIENAIWYSNQPDNCNDFCVYHIFVDADVNGNLVTAEEVGIFNVSATMNNDDENSCFMGLTTCCATMITGAATIETVEISPSEWTAEISRGTLKKDVKTEPLLIVANTNSQFYHMIVNEELHHQKQFEGTVPFSCFDDLYNVDKVMADIQLHYIKASSQELATQMATQVIEDAIQNEYDRGSIIIKTNRCKAEVDAKTAAGSSYKLALPCRYPQCSLEICP